MKRKFYLKKSVARKVLSALALIVLMIGCYEWKTIEQPSTANPNSLFEVKMTLQRPQTEDPSADPISAYAYFGVMLPEGWTVKDTITFEKFGQNDSQTVKDTLVFNATHIATLTADTMKVPSGYKWWAAKTLRPVEMIGFTTANFKIKVLTNGVLGDFKMKYVLGDDEGALPRFPYSDRAISKFYPITIQEATNVKDLWQKEEWQVYPNPSSGRIFVEQSNVTGHVNLKIFDLNGRILKQEVLTQSNTLVNLQKLPKGNYFVALEKNGIIKTRQIVLQ